MIILKFSRLGQNLLRVLNPFTSLYGAVDANSGRKDLLYMLIHHVKQESKVANAETKDNHLHNDGICQELNFGQAWVNKAGDKFRYFMVFNTNPICKVRSFDEFLKI